MPIITSAPPFSLGAEWEPEPVLPATPAPVPATALVGPRVFPSHRVFSKAPAEHVVDVADATARATRLVPFCDVMISDLPGAARAEHDALMSLGKITHHVPDEYARYYSAVSNVFQARPYAPGTVGAYYTSCASESDACALPCIGSLPRPGASPCNSTIIFARWNGSELVYERLVAAENKEKAILYIPAGAPFTGLPPSVASGMVEVMGIHSIRVVVYDPKTGAPLRSHETIQHLNTATEGFVPVTSLIAASPSPIVQAVKEQLEKIKPPPAPASTAATSVNRTGWIVLIVVALILIIAAILYAVYKMRRRTV